MSRFLLVIIVVLFAGDAVASDASWGNLRSILTRPIGRSRLLVAKAESAGVLAVIATALVVISGLLVAGIIAFGWHPLDLPLHGFDQSAAQIVGNLAIASVYVLWAMAGVAALAFMVSTMTDSPATVVFAGFGLYIDWIPTESRPSDRSATGSPRTTSTHGRVCSPTPAARPTADMLRGTLLQIPYVLVFGGIAWWHFRHKDILS